MPELGPAMCDGDSNCMHEQTSDLAVGFLMLVLGLVGLVMASGALDDAIYLFGLSLFGFAVVFNIGLVKRYFDRQEAARQGGSDV